MEENKKNQIDYYFDVSSLVLARCQINEYFAFMCYDASVGLCALRKGGRG